MTAILTIRKFVDCPICKEPTMEVLRDGSYHCPVCGLLKTLLSTPGGLRGNGIEQIEDSND